MLICAVAFAMTAYVLKQEATNWKDKHDALEKNKNAEIKKLTDENAALKNDLATTTQDRDNQQKEVVARDLKIGERDTEVARLNGELKLAQASVKRLEDDISSIKNDLKNQANDIKRLQGEKDAAVKARDTALEDQRSAEDKQRALEADLADLRKQLQLTKGDLKSALDLNNRYAQLFGEEGIRLTAMTETPPPKINGQVVNADNRSGIVMISVGKDDGVTVGMSFEVSRPQASQFVGRIRVTELYNQEAICRIVRPMTPNPIQEGDHVTTRVE